jgi:hypothetical protein
VYVYFMGYPAHAYQSGLMKILNPSIDSRRFLEGDDDDPPERQLTFSSNCICLEISGNDVADLSFCDLPGKLFSFTLASL